MVTRAKAPRPRVKAEGDYRHGGLRQALIDAASELVSAREGPNFTLREIATRVGVQHAAAYRHFASKEAILSALAARAFERMAARFEKEIARCGSDIEARLEGLADAYLSMVRDEPGAYRVMFTRLTYPDPQRDAVARHCFAALLTAMEDGQRAGVVRDDMPAIAVAAVNWAGLHGLSMLLLDKMFVEKGAAGGQKALVAALQTVHREGWSPRR